MENGVGFTPIQVESTRAAIVRILPNALWFIDPHHEKLRSRGVVIPEMFSLFIGYNDWKAQKKKAPTVWI